MDNIQEIWKDVVGYEGYYQISDHGRLKRTHKNGTSKIMSLSLDTWGYPKVILSRNCDPKPRRIHRLVAIHFVDNDQNKPQVNHKNGIKTDNRAINLEWTTPSENMKHAYANGLAKGRGRIVFLNNPRRKKSH